MNDLTILSAYKKRLESAASGEPMLTVIDSRQQTAAFDMITLDEKSSRAAACLRSFGCEKGDRVLTGALSGEH